MAGCYVDRVKKILLVLPALALAACAPSASYSGPPYTEATNLIATIDGQPVEAKTTPKSWMIDTSDYALTISPDSITPDVKGFNLILNNKTTSVMKIIWDDSVFSYATIPSPVFHEGIKYIDRNNSKPPTLIPPNGNLVDSVYPTKLAYFDDGKYTGGWKQLPVGKNVSVLLALEVNGKRQNLNIDIKSK